MEASTQKKLHLVQQPKPIQGRWLGWQAWGKPSARHPNHPGSQLAQWHLPRARRTSRASDHMSGGAGRGEALLRDKLTAPPKPKALARMSGRAVRRQGPTDRSSRNRVRKRRDRDSSQPSNGSAASKEEIGTSPLPLGNSQAARCWVAPDRVLQANPVLGRRRAGKPRGVRVGKCKCQQAGGVAEPQGTRVPQRIAALWHQAPKQGRLSSADPKCSPTKCQHIQKERKKKEARSVRSSTTAVAATPATSCAEQEKSSSWLH